MIRLLHVPVPPGTFFLLVSEVFLVAGSFVLATYAIADVDPADYLLYNYGLVGIGAVVLTFILGLHFQDLYTQIHVQSRILLLQQLIMVTGVAFLVQGLISYASVDLRLPVRVMLMGSATAIAVLFLWRLVFSACAIPMVARTELLMIGSSPVLLAAGEYIRDHPEMGLHIVRYVNENEGERLSDVVKETRPSRIVLGLSRKPDTMLARQLLDTRYAGYDIDSAAITYERLCGRIRLDSMRPEQMIYSATAVFQAQRLSYQVFLSGLVTVAATVLAAPLVVLAALALRVSGQGPVFRQKTLTGLNVKTFRSYEFDLSRSTGAARIVRRLRLGCLPRLWNVVRGEMAIIGPEPERQPYVDALTAYIPYYRERYSVRPGMTGWAQIHWRSGMIEDTLAKLEYDFYYIRNMSLGLDTLILLRMLKRWFTFEEG